jgi:hypothetical protein
MSRRLMIAAFVASCCPPEPAKQITNKPVAQPASFDLALPGESHLRNVRQLTFGGDNAEAYWSFSGDRLIFQTNHAPYKCDQIEIMPAAGGPGKLASTGKGRTTCSYFLKGDQQIVGVPGAARHVQGLPVGALRVRHLQGQRRRLEPGQPDAEHARLRRRGDGVPEGRLDHLHVDAQR